MGDYITPYGTEIHMTLNDAREKAKSDCIGPMKEYQHGYTTTFMEESTGRIIGEYYER